MGWPSTCERMRRQAWEDSCSACILVFGFDLARASCPARPGGVQCAPPLTLLPPGLFCFFLLCSYALTPLFYSPCFNKTTHTHPLFPYSRCARSVEEISVRDKIMQIGSSRKSQHSMAHGAISTSVIFGLSCCANVPTTDGRLVQSGLSARSHQCDFFQI